MAVAGDSLCVNVHGSCAPVFAGGSLRYVREMDVLSDAVTALRTGRPHSARVHLPAPFGRQFPPFEGAGFHLVLQGSCWLFPAQGTPIALGVGDVAFLPHGAMHALADTRLPPDADATVSNGSTGRLPARSGARQQEPSISSICS